MSNTKLRVLLAGVLLSSMAPIQASEFEQNVQQFQEDVKYVVREIKAALQSIDLYRTPQVPSAAAEELTLTCRELEWAMTEAVSQSYSYNPAFSDDPVQAAGIWVGTMYYPVYATVLYGVYTDYKEDHRVIDAEDRIKVLRYLKAEKRCYES